MSLPGFRSSLIGVFDLLDMYLLVVETNTEIRI